MYYLTHYHYNNSMSWDNSFSAVWQYDPKEQVSSFVSDCLARCDWKIMYKIIQFIKSSFVKEMVAPWTEEIEWRQVEVDWSEPMRQIEIQSPDEEDTYYMNITELTTMFSEWKTLSSIL